MAVPKRGLLLDSCILIARLGRFEAKHELAKDFLRVAVDRRFALAISAISLWELDAAIEHPASEVGPRWGTLDRAFASAPIKILPLDTRLHAVCRRKVRVAVKGADRAIIQTAVHYGRLLITTDGPMLKHSHAFGAVAQHPQAFIDEHA